MHYRCINNNFGFCNFSITTVFSFHFLGKILKNPEFIAFYSCKKITKLSLIISISIVKYDFKMLIYNMKNMDIPHVCLCILLSIDSKRISSRQFLL